MVPLPCRSRYPCVHDRPHVGIGGVGGSGGGQKKEFLSTGWCWCGWVGEGGGAEKRISVQPLMVWAYKEGMVEKKRNAAGK